MPREEVITCTELDRYLYCGTCHVELGDGEEYYLASMHYYGGVRERSGIQDGRIVVDTGGIRPCRYHCLGATVEVDEVSSPFRGVFSPVGVTVSSTDISCSSVRVEENGLIVSDRWLHLTVDQNRVAAEALDMVVPEALTTLCVFRPCDVRSLNDRYFEVNKVALLRKDDIRTPLFMMHVKLMFNSVLNYMIECATRTAPSEMNLTVGRNAEGITTLVGRSTSEDSPYEVDIDTVDVVNRVAAEYVAIAAKRAERAYEALARTPEADDA